MSEWIEIVPVALADALLKVSLYMSEWIEIAIFLISCTPSNVSLYMSEWIEMKSAGDIDHDLWSHSI